MKSKKSFAVLLLFLSSFFVSCSHQDYFFTTPEIITRGNWSVAYLNTGQDKTGDYEKYNLKFSSDGKVDFINNSLIVSGNWNVITDEKGTDLLTISVDPQNGMPDLNNRWKVTQKTTTNLSLLSTEKESQLRLQQLN